MKNIFLLFFLPLVANAQKDYATLLDQYVQSAADINHFNGTVLVAKAGKIIYQKSFGYKDVAEKYPLDNSSMFEIGKMTEQFTATAILLLKEKGRLKLTDPITMYFPELPYSTVTIHHILTHTSGLPDFYTLMKDSWKDSTLATNNDMIEYLANDKTPPAFEPGTMYEGDFTGYALLASVIEKVSGQHYETFMQENIFNPLKLQQTKIIRGLHVYKKNYPWHVDGIVFDKENKPVPAEEYAKEVTSQNIYYITDGIVGSTGISSTAGDLFLWSRALKNNKLFSAATQKEMFSAYTLKDTASRIFNGYGSYVGKNEIGEYALCIEEGNASVGFYTSLIRYTKEDNTIIVLTNKALNSSILSGTLAYILYDRDVVPLYVHKAMPVDSAILYRYAGKYAIPNPVELVKKEGNLYLRYTEQPSEPDILMLPESSNKIFSTLAEDDVQFEFVIDKKGNIIRSYLITRG